MARTISQSLLRSVQMQESGAAIIPFLTITHDDLAETIRVAGDGVDYLWQTYTWIGFPFDIGLLTDNESPPRAQLTIQNVDRRIGDALRTLPSPARLRLDLVEASEFDQAAVPRVPLGTPVISYTANHLFVVNVSVSAAEVTADLVSWDYTQDTFPARRATQDRYGALFR